MDKSKNFVITINREAGTGGRSIGAIVAKALGVKYFDKAVTEHLSMFFNLSKAEIEKHKAEKSWWMKLVHSYLADQEMETAVDVLPPTPTPHNIFSVEEECLKEIAATGSCVIAGRTTAYVFRDHPNAVRVLIISTLDKRVKRIMRKQNLTEQQAIKLIEDLDEGRENYTKKITSESRYDSRAYDLVINVANMSEQQAADLILLYVNSNGNTD